MTQLDLPDDGELLRSLLTGDDQALTTLYRRRHGAVYRFALQMSGSATIAEDVTQEVFMAIIKRTAEYDPTRGSVKAFLLGIARNLVLRRLRYQQAFVSFEDESDEDHVVVAQHPLDELAREETIETVRRAVLSLPAHYREIVILCELQEMSYAEAAAVLGCAVGTVRSRLHRARGLLIEKLRPVADEDSAEASGASARCFA
jgi:RNA polymerase sigma-70 factor (ECF subfamily)